MNISDTGYWNSLDCNGYQFDHKLAANLVNLLQDATVVDFGCGTCEYVKFLRIHNIQCDGYDGNPLTPCPCAILDLASPVDLQTTYDWVISLETGEHIPPQYETNFINNIHRHNTQGVIISWAIVGQGGYGHINERDNHYIKEIFASLGYTNDVDTENALRSDTVLSWFPNTIMVFRK